jgi:HPt (histidine-containing phosphotransfer) domain-containing protein
LTPPVAEIEAWLAALVPRFLANRVKDVAQLRAALAAGDLATVLLLGHNLKGAAAGYGFAPLAELGQRLEDAAERADAVEIETCAAAIETYARDVKVVYR